MPKLLSRTESRRQPLRQLCLLLGAMLLLASAGGFLLWRGAAAAGFLLLFFELGLAALICRLACSQSARREAAEESLGNSLETNAQIIGRNEALEVEKAQRIQF